MKTLGLVFFPIWILCAAEQLSVLESTAGLTHTGAEIRTLVTRDDFDYGTPKIKILVVGGSQNTTAAVRWFYESSKADRYRRGYALSAVPSVSPGDFPPAGEAYGGVNSEAQYLWRWIGMHAPDLVSISSPDLASLVGALEK